MEIAAKMPGHLSGNTVNGLGETDRRRPTPIMWHHPKRIPAFAQIQEVVNRSFTDHPRLRDPFNTPERREPHDAIAPQRTQDTPENWTRRISDFALANEADLVGVARVEPSWVFEGFEVREPMVVVLGVAMDHAEVAGVSETVKTKAGEFKNCVKTLEGTVLEPDNHETKIYARALGW